MAALGLVNFLLPMEMMRRIYPCEGQQERRINHYSSTHRILLVGEGDFSFALCLAKFFHSSTNIVATSFDSYNDLLKKYQKAKRNLQELHDRGAYLLHGVDATTMSGCRNFQGRKFHRIIFNFPHAGFYGNEDNRDLIEMHRKLVRGFLSNASCMLLPGVEIHLNHKLTPPFDSWNLKELASECSLLFIGLEKFIADDYLGYENKRGSGHSPDRRFPLNECGTFRYKLDPTNNGTLELEWWCGVFDRYLNHVVEMYRINSHDDVREAVDEVLRLSLEMYRSVALERPCSEYSRVRLVLHRLSIVKSEQLRQMLLHRN